MKAVPRSEVIYSYSPRHSPAEHARLGELVLLQTEDALGGQIESEKDSLDELDWSKVDGATGPIFVDTVPRYGILGEKKFGPSTKIVSVKEGYISFEDLRVKANPMIGTIGVAPESDEIPSGSLGRHGGNMDVKELTAGTTLYLPVFTRGALFAAGDLHAVQADGELCVSSVEVAGEILLRFNLIKEKQPEWPILETHDWYALLSSGDTLDEAVTLAADAAVKALMREYGWPFEKAYMFGSLAVDLEINQVVDPKKGSRAVMSKEYISLNSLLI